MTAEISRSEAGIWSVKGDLDLESIPGLLADCPGLPDAGTAPVTVDLRAVERIDSAGLALLLGWSRQARERGSHLRCRNVPATLRALAGLCGVAGLLDLA